MIPKQWFAENDSEKGYTWEAQAKYGTVTITQEALFARVEFQHFTTEKEKILYAHEQGWRFNVDNQLWYRLKGH